jgi:hypothetical protein
VSGNTKLPYKKNVERDPKLASDLKADRHPATRECKYQDVILSRVSSELKSQKPPSFVSIIKMRWHVMYSLRPGAGR